MYVSPPLQLSPFIKWSSFCKLETSCSTDKDDFIVRNICQESEKRTVIHRSHESFQYNILVFKVWLPVGVSSTLISWLCPVFSQSIKDSGISP